MKALTAQELRIGNYINGLSGFEDNSDKWELCKVVALDTVDLTDHAIWVESKGNTETFIDFTGIPLTEEWLLKFGFKKKKYDSEYWFEKIVNKKFRLLTNDIGPNGFSEKLEHVFVELRDFGNELVRVKYVHKLQNVVFEFIGEELQTK